jgi:hypothetical protein
LRARWWTVPEEEAEPPGYLPGTDIPYMTDSQRLDWQAYVDPVLVPDWVDGRYVDLVRTEVSYSLLGDIKQWFEDIHGWVSAGWTAFTDLMDLVKATLTDTWYYITRALESLATNIKDEIVGLANFVANIYTWVTWNLVDDVATFVRNLFKPVTDAWDAVVSTLEDYIGGVKDAIAGFIEAPSQWVSDALEDLWTWLESIADMIWDSLVAAADTVGSYIGSKLTAFAPVVVECLRDFVVWFWEQVKYDYYFVTDKIIPAVEGATTGAYGWLKDEFTHIVGLAYDEVVQKATELVPVTPERSVGIAGAMFGSAVGFGALAHSMALGVEAIPNLKYMGVHYLSAFVSRMGSFGTISSATMGVIAALAIREPFGYYMKSILRPTQPRELDLQIMAVKPDITLDTFRQGMKYMGYSDFWIDAFERTMYHEPSYFEMSMLAEDECATPDWLFTKARRSGYSEVDAQVFVSSMIKKVTRTQRDDFYKQAFNAFKEGYISANTFETALDYLDVRPEAKELATRAANLAYQTDLMKDYIKTWLTSLRDDLITEAECRTALAGLGIADERINAMLHLEWIKKQPKILKAERKEIEDEWREVQKRYTTLYLESFRRGLINEGELITDLVAIGTERRAAEAIASYEAVKLVPKIKPLEIVPPVIPAPPPPPTYED